MRAADPRGRVACAVTQALTVITQIPGQPLPELCNGLPFAGRRYWQEMTIMCPCGDDRLGSALTIVVRQT
jgi:hypothetical protein